MRRRANSPRAAFVRTSVSISVARMRTSQPPKIANLALQDDGDGVGLLAARAAGRPDSQATTGDPAARLRERKRDMRAEMVEMVRLAKELGVIGRDRVDEALDFRRIARRGTRGTRRTNSSAARAGGARRGCRPDCACCRPAKSRRSRRRPAPDGGSRPPRTETRGQRRQQLLGTNAAAAPRLTGDIFKFLPLQIGEALSSTVRRAFAGPSCVS